MFTRSYVNRLVYGKRGDFLRGRQILLEVADHRRAVRLLSVCATISHAWDPTIYFDPIASEEQMLATARTAFGENEFAGEVAAGQSLRLEQAILDALRSEPTGFVSESISASVPS